MRILIHAVWGVLFLGMSAGCLHSPPVGATRGVVEIKNMKMWDESDLVTNVGELTGVALDEHTVLTSGHAFLYDPEPDHPLKINGQIVVYSIVADGWAGIRGERKTGDKSLDIEHSQRDYLILQVDEPIEDFATLVPLELDRINEIRRTTLVTRLQSTGESVTVSIRQIYLSPDRSIVWIVIPSEITDAFYLSGSPIVAEYQDGTLVLVGIASGSGNAEESRGSGIVDVKNNEIYFVPAYRIPLDEFTE
jgi:hypothetical protein